MFGLSRAPEFPLTGLHWINTDHPLTLAELRGKLVILDFWTFCCINCMHVLPTLARIEKDFSDTVQVIGVHSPKFLAEQAPENVAAAVERYGIAHPVVHDPEMSIWQAYAVRAWPTLTLISPDGHLVGQVSGEPDPDRLEEGLTAMLHSFAARGELKSSEAISVIKSAYGPKRADKTAEDQTHSLCFPGKIKPLTSPPPAYPNARWAVADSGHHQIAFLDDAGTILGRIGSGTEGRSDGPAADASFSSPQGLCADASGLWIADTNNHLLRRYDYAQDQVSTAYGLGTRGEPLAVGADPYDTPAQALASPWDVEATHDPEGESQTLYLANAGTHQLGIFDCGPRLALTTVVGSGGENIVDGPAPDCLLAQPSGLSIDADCGSVWFADSETSAIRSVQMESPHMVQTAVGEGLFDFGHLDGAFNRALLQHPLGLCLLPDSSDLIVADSYNGALRRLHISENRVSTVSLGDCQDSHCLPLAEPAGVWAASEQRLLVSDTNNHRIIEVNLDSKSYRTWA